MEDMQTKGMSVVMKRRGFEGYKRVGLILAITGASMIVALMLPFWFWWLVLGLAFLSGGIYLLRKK